MAGWIVLGVLVLLIFAVCMVPVGFDAEFITGQLKLKAKACGIGIQILPREKKPKKDSSAEPKEEKPKKEKKQKKKKENKPLNLVVSNEELLSLLRKIPEGLGKLTGGIRVDRFLLHYLAAGKDPYDTAVVFGYVNAVLSSLAPVCALRFPCRDVDVRTDVDFTKEKTEIDFALAMSLRLGSVFAMVNTILFGALWILLKNKLRIVWCRRFNRKAYEEILIDESAATKLLKQLLEKKQAAKNEPDPNQENTEREINKNGESDE